MADQSWINRASDLEARAGELERQGRVDEAMELLAEASALVEPHGATDGMERLRATLASIPEETRAQVKEMAARVAAARKLSQNDPKSIWATRGGDKLPSEIIADELLQHWPDPIERRGSGGGSTITTPENLSKFERLIASGQTQKAAAQAVFEGLDSAEHKGDRLIKYWRKQRS
ncbi:hypothetical protein G7A66_13390 [Altererythrobacter sp. SALINAS58]|uniref:hypothetical protein n=1 Tax=Alteripontixanthobacter muriae TaxID=2705546 RepID=UPI001576F64D|nr:hypothetical protein [Alteripontixanthobacter muriae]NTZ44054.1 hypothetical protein [Alteripontixanthobacter muriae]